MHTFADLSVLYQNNDLDTLKRIFEEDNDSDEQHVSDECGTCLSFILTLIRDYVKTGNPELVDLFFSIAGDFICDYISEVDLALLEALRGLPMEDVKSRLNYFYYRDNPDGHHYMNKLDYAAYMEFLPQDLHAWFKQCVKKI